MVTWGSGNIEPKIFSLCTTRIKVAIDTTQPLCQSKYTIEWEVGLDHSRKEGYRLPNVTKLKLAY